MIVHEMAQRSPEWYAIRAGKLTGSCAGDMLATIKTGEAAAKRDLRMRLVLERLTGIPQDDGSGYVNAEMQRGMDLEPAALAAYEVLTGNIVQATGFVQHDKHHAGCSLDGHVGDWEGLVSVKCPKSATHLKYIRAGIMPPDYVPQMTHELWITGAQYYDFLSYDDRFPGRLQTFHISTLRDEGAIKAYEDKALEFLAEVERELESLQTMANLAEQLERSA